MPSLSPLCDCDAASPLRDTGAPSPLRDTGTPVYELRPSPRRSRQSSPLCRRRLWVGYKRKRLCTPEDITKGAARGHRFLQELAALPLDQMDMKQAMEHVNKLRTELENDASNFPWLQQFF